MLTVAYITFRLYPQFEWFAASLRREMDAHPDCPVHQVVVIDGRLWYDEGHRRLAMLDACGNKFRFEHHAPKPSIWHGPNRLTQHDYFNAASVRNTALCYTTGSHVAFVDDLSVLRPGWLVAHTHAMRNNYVLCGTTCKNKNIAVDPSGNISGFEHFNPGQDSRLQFITGKGLQVCSGGWLFGGTFSVPLEAALRVNGQDEICTPMGGEDYDFGIRLSRLPIPININEHCGTFEDEDGHHTEAPAVRYDAPWRQPDGPYTSNHLLNRLQREAGRTTAIGNDFNLRELRDRVLSGGAFPVPTGPETYWADGRAMRDL